MPATSVVVPRTVVARDMAGKLACDVMGEPAIHVRGLGFGYRGDPRRVLDAIDLTVQPGERVLVIGANGAGKTTLLRVIAGKHLVPPDRVRVLGRAAFHDPDLST